MFSINTKMFWSIGAALAILCSTGCSKDPEVAKREFFDSGNRYFEQGKYSEAIVEFRNAVQQDARYAEARNRLGDAYSAVGDLGNAYREYVRAADLLPDNAEVQIKAGSLLLFAGEFEDAETRALQVLAKDGSNVRAQILLGNALGGLKNYDEAIKQLEAVTKIDPTGTGYSSIGKLQFIRGNQAEAEAAFRRAASTDPTSVPAQLSLANFLASLGRYQEAEVSFKRAVELQPKEPFSNRALASFYLQTGRAAEAEPYLQAAADSDTSPDASEAFRHIDYLITFDRLDDAMKALKPLVSRPQAAVKARMRIAYIDFSQKRTETAYKDIDTLISEAPADNELLLMKGRFLANDRRFDEALALGKRVTAADSKNAPAWFFVGSVQRDSGAVPDAIASFTEVLRLTPSAVAAHLQLVPLLLSQGQIDQAVQVATEAESLAPNSPQVQLALARSLVSQGQLNRADPIVRGLLTSMPQDPSVHTTAGALAATKNNWAAARLEYQQALKLEPSNLEAFSGMVAVHLKENKTEATRAFLEEHVGREPRNAALLVTAANVYLNLQDRARAEALLKQAIAADPAHTAANDVLGKLYIAQGRLDLAKQQFDALVARNPKSTDARTMVAMTLELQGKPAEAQQAYEQVMQGDPNAALAANNLASMYADKGQRLDEALQLAQVAVRGRPQEPAFADTLGWVYIKEELANLAIEPLQRAVTADPKNPIYQFHLGLAFAKTGNKPRARTALQEAIKLKADFPGADEARRTLGTL